ncbi:hypothetical protein V8C42DRAFT_343942 [Trichoderma barbatum]
MALLQVIRADGGVIPTNNYGGQGELQDATVGGTCVERNKGTDKLHLAFRILRRKIRAARVLPGLHQRPLSGKTTKLPFEVLAGVLYWLPGPDPGMFPQTVPSGDQGIL